MPGKRRTRWLAGVGLGVASCLAGGGCHTTPLTSACAPTQYTARMAAPDARAEAAATLLAPQMKLKWSATSTKDPQTPPIDGESVIRADGMVDLGPYGFVRVGGMSVQAASNAIAQHLAKHMKGPKVRLVAMVRPAATAVVPTAPVVHTLDNPNEISPTLEARDPQKSAVAPAGWNNGPASRQGVTPTGFTPGSNLPPMDNVLAAGPGQDQEPGAAKGKGESQKDDKKNEPAEDSSQKSALNGTGSPVLSGAPTFAVGEPGPHCGRAPNELHKISLPSYVVEPPDILVVEYVGTEATLPAQVVRGQHLVRPDGTIGLGIYGSVPVAGLTLDQVRDAIFEKLKERVKAKGLDPLELYVDVLAYNSKVYYVITDGAGFGEQVYRFPIQGSETVLDGLAQINGLPPVASKNHIWVARRCPGNGPCKILPVDWLGITQGGATATNYQIMPGDRIYVKADCWRTFDTRVAKVLSPFERIFGFTLLGAQTVTAVKQAGSSTTNTGTTTGR
jgi:polysaccharide export outer membrane protein